MADEQTIQQPVQNDAPPDEQGGPQTPAPASDTSAGRKLYDQLNKSQLYTKSYDDFQQQFSNTGAIDKLYQHLNDAKLYTKSKDAFYDQFFQAQKPAPEHQIAHTGVQDIRHLNDLANQPVRTTAYTGSSLGVGTSETPVQEDVDRNIRYAQQYDQAIAQQAQQWGVDAKAAKRAIEDFSGESDEKKLQQFASLNQNNPVYYNRIKSANDIRQAIAQSGPQGVNDANVFNHLQTADNYQQLQDNVAMQQEIMRKYNLGQQYFEKLKQAQAPLVNTLDPGLHLQYWNSEDKKLGLSDFQYAGLETEKMFNPGKYLQDVKILRDNRGLDMQGVGEPNPIPQGKKGYAYDRGIENVLYALENQGRQNTGQFVSQQIVQVHDQATALRSQYQDLINKTSDPAEQTRLNAEYQNLPFWQEKAKLDEGAAAIDYARTEDQRRFPLNYGDQATRIVKDAMSGTTGIISMADVRGALQGAGEQSDNSIRFIKNIFINLLGSEQMKARNAASNIGHEALTDLAGYEGSAYSTQQPALNISDKLTQGVEAIMNNSSLTEAQKNQQATDLVRNSEDQITVNPKSGQHNFTGKAVIYGASNTIGQILGIADQSLLMGGLLGDASKAQQMANAFVPMYASTQNQLYEKALARGDEKPLLSSHLDATIMSLASLINPDIKVVKGMVGAETGIGKLIAGVDETAWNKVLSENKVWVDRMVAGTKATARQLGLANLQYGLIVPTAQYVVHKNILNEDPNLGDSIKDGLIQTSLSMALPALLHGVWGGRAAGEVNPTQKYSIVEAGLHPKENIELIDQLVEKGQITPGRADQLRDVIKQTGKIMENTDAIKSDGSWMNEQEVVDLTYNQLRKKVLEGKLKDAPDPQKPAIEAKIGEIEHAIADLHTSEADKQKNVLKEMLVNGLDKIKENIPAFEGRVREAIRRNEPESVFQEIAEQASKSTAAEGDENVSRQEAEETFGKDLVTKSLELQNNKTADNGKGNENAGRPNQAQEVGAVSTEKPQEGAVPPESGQPQEPAASSFLQSRHADTIHDEQGIVSGPNNKELSAKGRRDANDLAKDVEGKGVTTIITSGLERSKETGERVADKIGAKVENRPELNTWDIKSFDGLTDAEFKGVQKWFVEHPDEITYRGPEEKYEGKQVGESVNEYAKRVIPAMERLEKENGTDTLVINHSNNMMLWDAYLKNGREWNDQARADYLAGDKPEPATLHNQTNDNAVQESPTGEMGAHTGGDEGAGRSPEGEGVGSGQQGEAIPGEAGGEGAGQEPPGGAGGAPVGKSGERPERIGIHHAGLNELAEQLGLPPVEPGQYLSKAEYAARGRILIAGGADPEKIGRRFQRTGEVSADIISVARAHTEELTRQVNGAGDKYGLKGPEYAAAKEKLNTWNQEVMKPMGTKAGEAFLTLQGDRDIDYGSFTSIQRNFEETKKAPATAKETETSQALAEKVKEQDQKIADLQTKLDELHQDKSGPEEKKNYAKRAKTAADKFRKLKKAEFKFKDENGNDVQIHTMGITYNDLIELGAKAIEKSGELADGLAVILDKVKDADWYKGLSAADKDRFANELTDHYAGIADKQLGARIKALEKQLADLQQGNVPEKGKPRAVTDRERELKDQIYEQKVKMGLVRSKAAPQPKTPIKEPDIRTRFADKKGNTFTPEEAKAVWDHAKGIIDAGTTDFNSVVNKVSQDTSLSPDQVRHAIASPRGAKVITDKMYAEMNNRRNVTQAAQAWVESAGKSWPKKFFSAVLRGPSALVTFGHGSVAPITHAGTDLFRPSNWKSYFNFMLNSYLYSFGGLAEKGKARYEQAMGDLVNHPLFIIAKQAGLKVDPTDKSGDDYSNYQSIWGKIARMGERGFNAMKPYRMEQFAKLYDALPDGAKADKETRKAIAQMVNLSSGSTSAKIPEGADAVLFAPKLVASQYERIFTEPAKALYTLTKWNKATDAEKVQAKVVARHSGEMIATYVAALVANQAILKMAGSKNNINFTNPLDSDWMKFKAGGKTVDASGGMNSSLRFVGSLLEEGLRANGIIKTPEKTKPGDSEGSKILQQMRNKLAPALGDVTELFSGTDGSGNVLPWANVKPSAGREKMSVLDYMMSKAPIPVAEAYKTVQDGAKEKGMENHQVKNVLEGILMGILTGTTGAHISPDYAEQKKEAAKSSRRSR